MAVIAGTRYHYTDSANVGIDMSDTLGMLDPSDVPLLSLIGKDGLTATAVKHEWLEDVLRPLDSTVVTLGKQLSRRWYVGYERSVNSTTGSWQVIYRVAQRFTLRAQSGEDNALDAIWTWRWN